jgi:predicted hotdog family 3-hydroxylacyl-ACP dehydratase
MNQEQPAITTPEDERINNAVLQAQANLVQAAILMAQAVAAWEQWAESKRARIISL